MNTILLIKKTAITSHLHAPVLANIHIPALLLTKKIIIGKTALAILGTTSSLFLIGNPITSQSMQNNNLSISNDTLNITQTSVNLTSTTKLNTLISAIAPGDTSNNYVDITSKGTLNLGDLFILLTASPSNSLVTSETNGLQVTINQCSLPWTKTEVCPGVMLNVMEKTPISNIISKDYTPLNITNTQNINYLQLSITLPDIKEVTQNGILPSDTVQGLSTEITWSFTGNMSFAK